ncbi:unnamed protein product, partial [Closterium sp. NIES-64]
DLKYNQLTGPIPAAFGSLSGLQIINIDGNDVTCPADNTSCSQTPVAEAAMCWMCDTFTFCITCLSGGASGGGAGTPSSPSASPPPPKPAGSLAPPVSVVAAAIAVALTSLLFV